MPKNLEKLRLEKKNCWEVWSAAETKRAFAFSEDYKDFLDQAKTEREAVAVGMKIASKKGFKDISSLKSLKTGDKVFAVNKNRNLVLAVIGKKLLADGFKLVMSHVDAPHLDLKTNPLYEDESLAFFKTHYYGGIKKYHWPTIGLALHGTVVLANGKKIDISIGEKESEPIFMITDLLPHLGRKQLRKTLDEAIAGEELNIVAGSLPVSDKKAKERVKLAVLEHLNKEYGIIEEDFFSADLQAVPDAKARDLGFDRSLLAAYGQDDRVCAWTSLSAILDAKVTDETQICFWTDREEIGSTGNTGAQSVFIENFVANLLELTTGDGSFREVYKVFDRSCGFSSDVTAGLDPDYKEVHDLRNVARLGFGVAIEKYTGHSGKSGTSEASAEFTNKIRTILNKNKVIWQSAGLGKVDEGGGGTIAKFLSHRNMDIIDIGVPLFNMHAPLEIASKADIYSAYLAYKAFFQS